MDKGTQTEEWWLEFSQHLYISYKNSANRSKNDTAEYFVIETDDFHCKIPVNEKATQTDDYNDEKSNSTPQKNEITDVLKEVGWFVGKAALISGGVLGGIALAVPAMGFGAGGVAAGSLAALYQSSVLGGTIASGSAFAVLQSVGAAGLAASTQAALVGGSVAATGVQTLISKLNEKGANDRNDPLKDFNDADIKQVGTNKEMDNSSGDDSNKVNKYKEKVEGNISRFEMHAEEFKKEEHLKNKKMMIKQDEKRNRTDNEYIEGEDYYDDISYEIIK